MTIGWHFDNTYSKLSNTFKENIKPTPVHDPELVILNEAYLSEKSIGDPVDIKLGLDLSYMPETYWIDFIIDFEGDVFSPEGYNFNIPQSFFYINGEPFQDDNGNGSWDEGEWFDDEDLDEEYDEPTPYPTGIMTIDENSFIGGVGILNPSNDGNAWGTGRVCEFHLSGILVDSDIGLEITSIKNYEGANGTISDYNLSCFNIVETLTVDVGHNPSYWLQQEAQQTDGVVVVTLQIDDSPKIAEFQSSITYDRNHLDLISFEWLEFFSDSDYSLSYEHVLNTAENEGDIIIEVDNNNQSFSEGTGVILQLNFIVTSSSSSSTLNLLKDHIIAKGFTSGSEYYFDINYWNIEENLEVDLTND